MHGVSNLNAVSDGFRVLRTIGHEFMRARAGKKQNMPSVDDGVFPGLQPL